MEHWNLVKRALVFFIFFLLIIRTGHTQNSITALPYAPGVTNFNTYNPTSQANALATIPAGWSFSCTGTPVFNGQTLAASATAGYWAYAPLLNGGDLNIGALRDNGTGNITYQVNYTNNTGGFITTLVLVWDYEQFRFTNTSGWSCAGTGALTGNAVLPTKGYTGASSSFLNLPTTTAVNTFTLSGLSIANGASFGIAWTTDDPANADNGVAIDDFEMSASAISSVTLANGSVPSGTVLQTSVNNVLYRSDVTVGVTPTTLTAVSFTTAGTYSTSNLINLKLWHSANSVFSPTATLLSTRTATLGPGVKTFSGLSQVLPLGTGYFFLTADLNCSGAGSTLFVQPIAVAGFTFSNGVKTGSGFTGSGTMTISPVTLSAVSSVSICAGKTMPAVTFTTQPAGVTVNWNNNNTAIGLAASGTGNIAAYTAPNVTVNTAGVITATLGACSGSSISVSMLVKSSGQAFSVWTGTVSGDWTNSDNWTNCACTGVTDATVPAVSSPAFNPTLSAGSEVKNLLISPGGVLNALSGRTLTVRGNWLNHGTFNAETAQVLFTATGAQTIGGTAITTFNDVAINNTNGVTLNSTQYIGGNLQLINGIFNTNNLLTLVASASGTGRIGQISSSADIINNVTIQQRAPGGSTGWALLGSSLNSPLTMAAWNDNFIITCQSCPNGYNNFTSVYSYNESVAGSYSASAKYTPINSITDNIGSGRGYWVYLGNAYPNTSDIIFDVTGTVAKSSCLSCSGPVTLPVSFTSNNGVTDDGWNLISNPLPSPISWTALRNGNASVDNAVYVYNTDLNGGAGAHTSYINGVSSHAGIGITDVIPMHQGFYIHATASTQLTASESVKINSNPIFQRPAQQNKPVFRVVMNDNAAFEDMATFYFEQGGSVNFQTDFDAYKLNFDETTTPYVASMSGTVLTGINGLPELNNNYSVPVKAMTPVTKQFVFSSLQQDFPNNVCATLYDSYTGVTTNILSDSYTCTLSDTTTLPRFVLNFFTGTSVGTSALKQPDCAAPTGGIISSTGEGNGPWNYEWRNGNTVIKTTVNKNGADSLTGLNGGNYTVKVSTVGQCDIFSPSFVLDTIVDTDAEFSPSSFTCYVSNSGQIGFTNNSINPDYSFWDFGDGYGTSVLKHPLYNYQKPGTYTVSLITESSTNCRDTARHLIHLVNDMTGTGSLSEGKEFVLTTLERGLYDLRFVFETKSDLEIQLYDLKGSVLNKVSLSSVAENHQMINLSSYASGIYLLTVLQTGTQQVKTFKITN